MPRGVRERNDPVAIRTRERNRIIRRMHVLGFTNSEIAIVVGLSDAGVHWILGPRASGKLPAWRSILKRKLQRCRVAALP
jgi:hypothetical protein